jgi:hypothetical protein
MVMKRISNVCYRSLAGQFSCLFLLLILIINKPAYSQVGDSGQILRAGTEDANLLLSEYLKPFGGGFGADLNTGWFTSAHPLKKFGFDLRVSVSASFVPVQDRSFDVTQLNLNTVKLLDGPSRTPTVFGDETQTSTLGSTEFNSGSQQEDEIFSFNMPNGTGYHFVPAPMAQFTLGLPGHSQVTLRYSPELEIENDYRLRVFGIGGLVGLNQLLFDGQLPVDLSIQAGIMDLSANAQFNVLPPMDENIENRFPDSHWEGQAINFDTNTFTANLIIGKKLSILSLFGGVGYQYASTKINTEGPYPIVVPIQDDSYSGNATHEIESAAVPINFTLEGTNDVHALGGLQLKLGFISISASYTVAEYSTLRAGVGIMFRS